MLIFERGAMYASALRVTRRNPKCNRLSMAGRGLPAKVSRVARQPIVRCQVPHLG